MSTEQQYRVIGKSGPGVDWRSLPDDTIIRFVYRNGERDDARLLGECAPAQDWWNQGRYEILEAISPPQDAKCGKVIGGVSGDLLCNREAGHEPMRSCKWEEANGPQEFAPPQAAPVVCEEQSFPAELEIADGWGPAPRGWRCVADLRGKVHDGNAPLAVVTVEYSTATNEPTSMCLDCAVKRGVVRKQAAKAQQETAKQVLCGAVKGRWPPCDLQPGHEGMHHCTFIDGMGGEGNWDDAATTCIRSACKAHPVAGGELCAAHAGQVETVKAKRCAWEVNGVSACDLPRERRRYCPKHSDEYHAGMTPGEAFVCPRCQRPSDARDINPVCLGKRCVVREANQVSARPATPAPAETRLERWRREHKGYSHGTADPRVHDANVAAMMVGIDGPREAYVPPPKLPPWTPRDLDGDIPDAWEPGGARLGRR